MKILVGTNNVANNAVMICEGFNRLGFKADVAVFSKNPYYSLPQNTLDISSLYRITSKLSSNDQKRQYLKIEYPILLSYDVYVFICSGTLLPGNADLELLKDLNKIIIFYNTGSDQRYGLIASRFYSAYDVIHPTAFLNTTPNQHLDIDTLSNRGIYEDTFSRKMHNIRMAEYYSDAYITLPSVATLNVKPFMSLTYVMDTPSSFFNKQQNDIPIIAHAPTNTIFKQTSVIINTIMDLWSEGLCFKFMLLRNHSNIDLLDALKSVDILLDQITVGAPALLANEGLAMGCVVASCNTKDTIPTPQEDIPVLDINNKNIKDVLRPYITDKQLRINKSKESICYNELGLHTPQKIAQEILESLERSLKGDFDCYPSILYDYFSMPEGEKIPPYLISMTSKIIKNYGAPSTAHLDRLSQNLGAYFTSDCIWELSNKIPKKWGWVKETFS